MDHCSIRALRLDAVLGCHQQHQSRAESRSGLASRLVAGQDRVWTGALPRGVCMAERSMVFTSAAVAHLAGSRQHWVGPMKCARQQPPGFVPRRQWPHKLGVRNDSAAGGCQCIVH